MRKKKFMIAGSIASVVIAAAAIISFIPSRQSAFTSFASPYKSMYGEKKGRPYKKLGCVSSPDKSKIDAVFLIKVDHGISPKGVPWSREVVAITHNPPNDSVYTMQILDTRNGKCRAVYASVDDEGVSPLERYVAPDEAIEIQKTWVDWQLRNVPNYRKNTQKYLDSKIVNLTKDEYAVYKKLGFKMPKKWQEIK
jgi:hypothetical protein